MSSDKFSERNGAEFPESAIVAEDPTEGVKAALPGWIVSICLHSILILGATIVMIEKYVQVDRGNVGVGIARASDLSNVTERPKEDPNPQKGIPTDDTTPPTNDEPIIYFPEAQDSDHNESADNEPYHAMKGDSPDFLSHIKGEAGGFRGRMAGPGEPGVYDPIGIGGGGGGGGRHGRPDRGGMLNLRKRGSGGRGTGVVQSALQWLARHQSADGSWSVRQFQRNCGKMGYRGVCTPNRFEGNESFDVGVTGLALLAFLGAGHTPASRERAIPWAKDSPTYGEIVKAAIRYLMSVQDASGRFGPEVEKYMYNHTIAAYAMCEAYCFTDSPELKEAAQRGINHLCDAKNPGLGWRYSSKCGDTDSSVTGWAVMALKAAELDGIAFDQKIYEDVKKWYDTVTTGIETTRFATSPKGSRGTGFSGWPVAGYQSASDAGQKVVVDGVNNAWDYDPSMTAIMVMSRVFIDHKITDKASGAVDTILAFLPQKWNPEDPNTHHLADLYYWYYASYALFQATESTDPRWKKWTDALKPALIDTQNRSEKYRNTCKEGAWEPVDRWACEGGRVYTTAMGALTWEVFYRYPKVALQSAERAKSAAPKENK